MVCRYRWKEKGDANAATSTGMYRISGFQIGSGSHGTLEVTHRPTSPRPAGRQAQRDREGVYTTEVQA